MKFHSDGTVEGLRVTGYGDGYVTVVERRLEISFALHGQAVHTLAHLQHIGDVTWAALSCLHESPPEILILGTGSKQAFPAASLYTELAAQRIGLEVMSTPAACRTYNILRSEDRNVAAVLLPPRGSTDG